jgi:hypothetical protein
MIFVCLSCNEDSSENKDMVLSSEENEDSLLVNSHSNEKENIREIKPDYFLISDNGFNLFKEQNDRWFLNSYDNSRLYIVPYTDYSITTAILTNEAPKDNQIIDLLESEGFSINDSHKTIKVDSLRSKRGIKLGMKENEVLKIFGAPDSSFSDTVLFWNFRMMNEGKQKVGGLKPYIIEGLHYFVEAKFKKERLTQIIYKYQVP